MADVKWQTLEKFNEGRWTIEGDVSEDFSEVRLVVERDGETVLEIVGNPANALESELGGEGFAGWSFVKSITRLVSGKAADWLEDAFNRAKLNILPGNARAFVVNRAEGIFANDKKKAAAK